MSALQSGLPRSQVGSHVEAGYVLDGSIRSSGSRYRVTAQLVETGTGLQIWSDRYTIESEDPFETQDYLNQHIVSGVTTQLKTEMLTKAKRKTLEELTPFDCWLRGFALLQSGTEANSIQARELFERAIRIDPYYARSYCGMSLYHFNEWGHHAWDDWDKSIDAAIEHAHHAIRLDETDHVGHCLLGRIHVYRREYDRGQRHLEQAYALNAFGSDMLATAALSWCFLGEHEHAEKMARNAIDLHPSPPEWYYGGLAITLFMQGAIEEARLIREKAPHAYFDTLFFLAAGHAMAGRQDRAREYAAAFETRFQTLVLRGRAAAPGEIKDWIRHANPFRRKADIERLEEAMTLVGLSEA